MNGHCGSVDQRARARQSGDQFPATVTVQLQQKLVNGASVAQGLIQSHVRMVRQTMPKMLHLETPTWTKRRALSRITEDRDRGVPTFSKQGTIQRPPSEQFIVGRITFMGGGGQAGVVILSFVHHEGIESPQKMLQFLGCTGNRLQR